MFFSLRSRLLSLLQPWLQSQLDLELNLGFLHSTATAQNLNLNVSALNPLLDTSTTFVFKQVRVERVRFRFSSWHVPALTLEAQGFHVILTVREENGTSCSSPSRSNSTDRSGKEKKEILSVIDPEGTALHDVIERISITTARNGLGTSLLNVLLKYCHLTINDIHFEVQLPAADDSLASLLNIKEFSVKALRLEHTCLLIGLVGGFFIHKRVCSLVLNASGLEIGLQKEKRVNYLLSPSDLFTSIKLKDLRVLELDVYAPEFNFAFSPVDLPILLAFNMLPSQRVKHARNGRELWNIAARKINYKRSNPRISLHKVVDMVRLWLDHVNAYKSLLVLVGYPAETIFRDTSMKMSVNKIFSARVKQHWKVVSEIEKVLPVETLARARRIARQRAAMHVQRAENSSEMRLEVCRKLFCYFFVLVSSLIKSIGFIFQSVLGLFFAWGILSRESKDDETLKVLSEGPSARYCFQFGKLSITLSPLNAIPSPDAGKLESLIDIYHLNTFCVAVGTLFLIYRSNNFTQSLSISCGDLKVNSSTSVLHPLRERRLRKDARPFKGQHSDFKAILWSEPALKSLHPDKVVTGSDTAPQDVCILQMQQFLEELWSNWIRYQKVFKRSNFQYLENPFFLCEIKCSLWIPCFQRPDYGLWKCNMSIGKLNLDLGHSSIMSLCLLLRQVQHSSYTVATYANTRVLSQSVSTTEEPKEVKLGNFHKLYASRIKMVMLGLIPEKKLQIGVAIAGAKVRILMQEEIFHAREHDISSIANQGHDDLCISFGLENIQLAVWPTSKARPLAVNGKSGEDDVETNHPISKECQLSKVLQLRRNEKFISQGRIALDCCLQIKGLSVYLEDLNGNQQCQVIGLKPVIVQSLSCREYVHSFTTSVTALSMSICVMATGLTVLSYMDELLVFFQVVESILSAVLYASTSVEPTSGVHIQHILGKNEKRSKQDPVWFPLASENGASMILKSAQFALDASFKFKSLDIIMHNSRESHILKRSKKTSGVSSNKKLTAVSIPENGIAVSVQNLHAQISWDEMHIETSFCLSGIRSVMFKYQSQIGGCIDEYGLSNLLRQSPDYLYEFSLSNYILTLRTTSSKYVVSSGEVKDAVDDSMSGSKESSSMCNSSLTIPCEESDAQSFVSHKKKGPFQILTSSPPVSPSYQFTIDIVLGEVFIATRSLKGLTEAHQEKEFLFSVSIGGDFRTVSCTIQGGLIFMETVAFSMFLHCFYAHLLLITNIASSLSLWEPISSGRQTESIEPSNEVAGLGRDLERASSSLVSETRNPSGEFTWPWLEALSITLSRVWLVLAVADGNGVWQLVLETDCSLNSNLIGLSKKWQLEIHRLTILSQRHNAGFPERSKDIHILDSSSVMINELSSHSVFQDATPGFHPIASIPPVFYDASSSSSPVPEEEENESEYSHFNYGNCILKHGAASILIEKAAVGNGVDNLWPKSHWLGSGSFRGFDLTISLSDIQMLLSLIAPISGNLSGRDTGNSKQRHLTRSERQDNILEDLVHDGAVVAIQDIHQHMYLAVQGMENEYQVTGAIHYSLVGKRALFRVKFCNRKKWGSPALYFTLASLHAKNASGESLRLNYRSGSGFVDISGTDDSGWALWKILEYKHEDYEGDSDLEPYNQSSKNTFNLVNKKCDCAVAFIDGVPEFVQKPGNPFKIKVFSEFSLAHDVLRMDSDQDATYDKDIQDSTSVPEVQTSEQARNLPYVNITADKFSLKIVHELQDANDTFPLLQACINSIQVIVQVLPSKVRLMSTFTSGIFYFDAEENLWREIVCPVEMYIFYHWRLDYQRPELVPKEVPTHFYFRTNQVKVSVTERSMDILLYMVGELDLAGPYAVRSSMIFSNCCKVENRTSLNLLSHFYGNQDLTVSGNQVASVFLRHGALANRFPENMSFVSLQLAAPGTYTTSPIHVSVMHAQLLAWRTRFLSLQDSRTYPGPFVVVDVSKKSQGGPSIVVSPLLRIHNETGFSMALRFCRPQQEEAECASLLLRPGDALDDSKAALDALSLSGGSKKTLMSLTLGNFLFSCRPVITDYSGFCTKPISTEWSEDLKGGKAVRLSGIFDKLGYGFRRALGVESMKGSFSTVHCAVKVEGAAITDLHFLIQTIGRDVPVTQPDNPKSTAGTRIAPVALQEQREIFLLPTVRVFNHLQSEIQVHLAETHPDRITTDSCLNIGKQATVSRGSSAYLYANPAMIYFTVILTEFESRSKPVNSGDWLKKLQKKKGETHYLDIDLEFCGGKYYASLRLSRGNRGILEATVFTSYTLQNNSDLSLICSASNQKPLTRTSAEKSSSSLSPEFGSFLLPNSTTSWFLKSNKVNLKLAEEKASVRLLDLDSLSGFTEVSLEIDEGAGVQYIEKLGISLKAYENRVAEPSQTVLMVPRYVISNETGENIFVRQCYLEGDTDGIISLVPNQKTTLRLKTMAYKRREINLFDSLLKKHRTSHDECSTDIQFCLDDIGWSWSGPICVASLGRFFLKFRRQLDSSGLHSNRSIGQANKMLEYAVIHTVEERSTLVLHFHRPPNIILPYRIENLLQNAFITYYQKDSSYSEILRSGCSINYVWDDLSLPHQLVVQISDVHLSRDINMDKVRPWKPFFKVRQQRGLALDLPLDKKPREERRRRDESDGLEMMKIGYEVYADGPTRVLRISEFPGRSNAATVFLPCAKIQLRVSNFAVQLLEKGKQDEDASEPSIYSPIIVARLFNINLDSIFTDQSKYSRIKIQSLDVDEKWVGAPFAAMLRRNQTDHTDMNESVLQVVFILLSANSGVKHVKYFSIILQPLDLNLDEETLMKLAPFWRTSLSDKNVQSQQFYFEHFEIHPIKIVASFLPGSPDSDYSSAQETLRSFIHSVIKIPAVRSKNVELNGILVTHVMVTVRELFVKCAQHYSWYAMRAVYIAKGSPLLPPAFASIFDDSASSSLDVFFDPSSGLINLPGLTLGMFKFVSKCIDKKGFSGTKRYFGDLGKTIKIAGSNVIFAAITEISDCILKGAEANGFSGMLTGFHHGILKLAMEPSLLGTAVMEGGPDRKIKLDRSPGIDELYIEGYLQAMLDTMYKQEYLRVRVIDNQVILKNLPPNSSLMNEILDNVKSFLTAKALLQGDSSTSSRPLRYIRGEKEWKIGPTVLTLWEHLFVSFAIRMLRKQAFKFMTNIKWKGKAGDATGKAIIPTKTEKQEGKLKIEWGIRKFVFSGVVAYIDGRLCRCIPNAIVRRIVSGFLLSLLDNKHNTE